MAERGRFGALRFVAGRPPALTNMTFVMFVIKCSLRIPLRSLRRLPYGVRSKPRRQRRLQRQNGEGEIRTPEPLARLTVFETAAFDRSATSPRRIRQRTTKVFRHPLSEALRLKFIASVGIGQGTKRKGFFTFPSLPRLSGTLYGRHVPSVAQRSLLYLKISPRMSSVFLVIDHPG
jgi:hypothetical protein